MRKLRTDFGRREAPYVHYLVKKVKETGILIDKPKREKPKTMRMAPSTIVHFGDIIETNFAQRTRYDAIQLVQELKPIEHPTRLRFVKWACDRLAEDADFGKKKLSFQMKHIFILADI